MEILYHNFWKTSSLVKSALIRIFGGSADDAGLLAFKTAPAVQNIATEAVNDEQAKQHHRGVNVDCRNAKGNEHNHHKGHALLHADIFEAVKGHVGDHGEP